MSTSTHHALAVIAARHPAKAYELGAQLKHAEARVKAAEVILDLSVDKNDHELGVAELETERATLRHIVLTIMDISTGRRKLTQ